MNEGAVNGVMSNERPLDAEEIRGYARREARRELQQQTVEWLLHLAPWDCFLTCTFKLRVPKIETGRQIFESWWKRHWHGVPTFYAVELHPGGHGAHIHGLMALARLRIQRTDLWESWFKVYGRCSFKPPRSAGAVAGYCASGSVLEVLKDGCWGLLGVTQNARKLQHVLRRQVPITFVASTVDVVTIADVIEGNKGLPGPELNLSDQVNLWK
jgi:hypothetical protein